MADKLFHDLVTLFVVVNPIGVVPLFVAVAGHETAAARRRIAGQAILISTVTLFVHTLLTSEQALLGGVNDGLCC